MVKFKQYTISKYGDWGQFLEYLVCSQGFSYECKDEYRMEYKLAKYKSKSNELIPSILVHASEISPSSIEINFYNGDILSQEEFIDNVNSIIQKFIKLTNNRCRLFETIKKKFVFKNIERWKDFRDFIVNNGYFVFEAKVSKNLPIDVSIVKALKMGEVLDSISAKILDDNLVNLYYSGSKDIRDVVNGSALNLINKYMGSLSDEARNDVEEVNY